MYKKLFLAVVVMMAFWPAYSCKADDIVLLHVTNESTGKTQLSQIVIREKQFDADAKLAQTTKTNPSAIVQKLVSTGLTLPVQGLADSIFFWKKDALWRYRKGQYLSVWKDESGPGQAFYNGDEFVAYDFLSTNAKSGINILRKNGVHFDFWGGIYAKDKGINTRAIGWSNANDLIFLRYEEDAIKRLQKTSLGICNFFKSNKNKDKWMMRQVILFEDPNIIVLKASAHQKKIVFQGYDESTKKFKIGILTDIANPKVTWLPEIKTDLGGKLIPLGVETLQVKQFAWSPNGNFIAVVTSWPGTLIWDTKDQAWLKRKANKEMGIAERDFFDGGTKSVCWLDDDRLLSIKLKGYSPIPSAIYGGRISEFDRGTHPIGVIKEGFIEGIFKTVG